MYNQFVKQLVEQIFSKKSFLCVGLDTDISKMPQHIAEMEDPIFEFNKAIIDATADYCVSYKPNLAFYEAYGVKGLVAFEKTVDYLKKNYPNHFIIADAKRGDIGNTSAMYAKTFFEEYNLDSLTVAPYMGEDSVKPFLEYDGKWVILLALTSNKGSHDFQLTAEYLHTSCRLPPCAPTPGTSRKWFGTMRRMSSNILPCVAPTTYIMFSSFPHFCETRSTFSKRRSLSLSRRQ